MKGLLIAFEGLDQSGKQTQAEMLRDRLVAAGRLVRLGEGATAYRPVQSVRSLVGSGRRGLPSRLVRQTLVAIR